MSLKATPIDPVPEETARIARAAFPQGTRYLRIRDALGILYEDQHFADLFPQRGQPAEVPWRLALVTIMQFAEDLSDRQAAEAVRSRIDWKYILSLPLTDAGFDASVLCEFRARLVAGSAEERLLEVLLDQCRARGWLKAHGHQRTDSTHVLAAIRRLNRLESVGEAIYHVLNVLAEVAPGWTRAHAQPAWVERYTHRAEDYRLPKTKEGRQAYAEAVGADGWYLLAALEEANTPAWLRDLPAVQSLRRIWAEQYFPLAMGGQWRPDDQLLPAGDVQNSPYDADARYAQKRDTCWVGYKVHLTETCEPDQPHLITQVMTTLASTPDDAMTTPIHQCLQARQLLPERHLVDTGYLNAELLVTSRDTFGVELVGPTRADYKWQAREHTGFAASQFVIDWQAQRAICPEGHTSLSWTPARDHRRHEVIKVKFSSKDCRQCPSRSGCTHAARHVRRTLTLRPEAQYLALQAARAREKTETFAIEYDKRAGIEGTHSQGVRAFGLRRARYRGHAKTRLQQVIIAASMNLVRISAWLAGTPHAQTHRPAFARLMVPAA